MQLALLSALLSSDPVSAPRISWVAPPQCPTAMAVESWTSDLLPASGRGRVFVRAEANVQLLPGGGFRLDLTMVSPRGRDHRVLQDQVCETLARATAVIVAVAADPMAVVETLEQKQPRGEDAQPAPPAETDIDVVAENGLDGPEGSAFVAPTAAPVSSRRPAWQAALRLVGIAGFGVLPRGDFGFGIALAAVHRHGRIELYGLHGALSSARYDSLPDVGADLQLWAGGVRGCGVLSHRSVEFPLCGAVEAGAVLGEGTGVARTRRDVGPWAAIVAGPAVAYRPDRHFALWLGVEGHVALTRPAFFIQGIGAELYRTRPAGVRAVFGIEVRVP